MSKWFNKNIKTIKKKELKRMEKTRSTTVVMTNKDGQLQEVSLPPDLR